MIWVIMIEILCSCNCHTYNHKIFKICQMCADKNEPDCGHLKFKKECSDCIDFLFENGGWQYVALGMNKNG